MHVWRHLLLTRWFVDSLFFATPNSKRVLMGTKVGGEVHGNGQRKRNGARQRAWRVRKLFFGFYALLATRFSFPIRRVRGREARCLRRQLFTYSSQKNFRSRVYAFRSALFRLVVFNANYLDFQLFRKSFRRVSLIFLFYSGAGDQRTRAQPLDPTPPERLKKHECLKAGPSPRAVAPKPTSVDRGLPQGMATPKLGLDETMELISRVLGSGDEDPDLSAFLAALKTNLGLSDLKKPPPTMSPGVELLTRDVKSCRGIRSSPMDTCPSPFHRRVRTVTVCSVGEGKGTPNLFYRRPTNNKGGPCHAPDCDGRSACMLQLKRTQKTEDGQEVKHHDHFRCTIKCGFCGKRRHYEDECHIKRC